MDPGAKPRTPFVPRHSAWLYASAPLFLGPLLMRELFERGFARGVRGIVALYLPFAVLTAATQFVLTFVIPKVDAKLSSSLARQVVGVTLVTVVPLVGGPFLAPLFAKAVAGRVEVVSFTAICVVVTWIVSGLGTILGRYHDTAEEASSAAAASKHAATEATLTALQSRTNPHFLFNALNTAASLIHDDPVLAERTLERLSDLFRYSLDSAATKQVPLARELTAVKEYLAIQSARFGPRLAFDLEIPTEFDDVLVPPLSLQPLVENAVVHGLRANRTVKISISATRQGGALVLSVIDDGPGPFASGHEGSGTSVRELGERLRLLYGEEGSVSLEAGVTTGSIARLKVRIVRGGE